MKLPILPGAMAVVINKRLVSALGMMPQDLKSCTQIRSVFQTSDAGIRQILGGDMVLRLDHAIGMIIIVERDVVKLLDRNLAVRFPLYCLKTKQKG